MILIRGKLAIAWRACSQDWPIRIVFPWGAEHLIKRKIGVFLFGNVFVGVTIFSPETGCGE